MKIRRGDIFVTDLESVGENVGSEQSSRRPAVIIQNDTGNEYSPTTIVAFITTKNKQNIPSAYKQALLPVDSLAGTDTNHIEGTACKVYRHSQ